MVRLRTTLHAVPSRVWTAVAGLAVLASLSLAVVLGAGLQVWRGAVGSPSAAAPAGLSHVPRSGLVTVPSGPAHRAASTPAGHGTPAPQAAGPPAAPASRAAAPRPAAAPSPAAPVTGAPTPSPVVATAVVPLDALLASLHGPERKTSMAALSALAQRPAVAWSVNGTVEGEGPDALIRLVATHASGGVTKALAARIRHQQRTAAAPPRPAHAAARGAARGRPHGHANGHKHHPH